MYLHHNWSTRKSFTWTVSPEDEAQVIAMNATGDSISDYRPTLRGVSATFSNSSRGLLSLADNVDNVERGYAKEESRREVANSRKSENRTTRSASPKSTAIDASSSNISINTSSNTHFHANARIGFHRIHSAAQNCGQRAGEERARSHPAVRIQLVFPSGEDDHEVYIEMNPAIERAALARPSAPQYIGVPYDKVYIELRPASGRVASALPSIFLFPPPSFVVFTLPLHTGRQRLYGSTSRERARGARGSFLPPQPSRSHPPPDNKVYMDHIPASERVALACPPAFAIPPTPLIYSLAGLAGRQCIYGSRSRERARSARAFVIPPISRPSLCLEAHTSLCMTKYIWIDVPRAGA
ncbi:hypothetical protein PLICRDRAFT_170441 [Plicaturopsis crispa FD-325 SS-3]|nr:hypothetical protein PLICRDRAFT_170441 [Plicaturopsis crispa FD-325 SS-3]